MIRASDSVRAVRRDAKAAMLVIAFYVQSEQQAHANALDEHQQEIERIKESKLRSRRYKDRIRWQEMQKEMERFQPPLPDQIGGGNCIIADDRIIQHVITKGFILPVLFIIPFSFCIMQCKA